VPDLHLIGTRDCKSLIERLGHVQSESEEAELLLTRLSLRLDLLHLVKTKERLAFPWPTLNAPVIYANPAAANFHVHPVRLLSLPLFFLLPIAALGFGGHGEAVFISWLTAASSIASQVHAQRIWISGVDR
jgi:hypothetical protein